MYILLDMYHIFIIICCVSDMTELVIPIPTYCLDTTELYEQLFTGGPRSVAVWWRTYTHWDGV